jgi:signal transduction histidine kinase
MRRVEVRAQSLFGDTGVYDFRKQQTAFCVLTLFVLGLLLLLHTGFAYVLGEPSLPVIFVLGLSFGLRLGELVWLQSRTGMLRDRAAKLDGAISILMLFALAGLLAWLTNRDHSPYQVLLAITVMQSACLFGLLTTVLTIIFADGIIFLWLDHYFALHQEPSGNEYLEAGMLAIVFALAGMLTWVLVRILRSQQEELTGTITELHTARVLLAGEEKLAAVGRLASGIAHEIRNPVAIIVNSIATAIEPATGDVERQEMFTIADRQARRLETLTSDFLLYAKPSIPHRESVLIGDLVSVIASLTRIRAAGRDIQVMCGVLEESAVEIDTSQIEAALLNLTINAIDATPEGGSIAVRAALVHDVLRIDVEDSGTAIPETASAKIFEPFFTTKPTGTGLGLAIARASARAHGGDLWVSNNETGHVVFTMILAASGKELRG